MLRYTPTPLQEIQDKLLDVAGIRLIIKREDLNHPHISGNKWWKLKYNLEDAKKQQKKTLLTFGGAYSNHIYSTAAAALESGFESIGIIRGEETLPLNDTLTFARSCGMAIHYISREEYRKKNEKDFVQRLQDRFGDFYLIPEGGTNEFAVRGCAEFSKTFLSGHIDRSGVQVGGLLSRWQSGYLPRNDDKIDFDYLCLPVGTGGTMAGIIEGLEGNKEIIGFSVLKGGDFLKEDIEALLKNTFANVHGNWKVDVTYHFGGYAKATKELLGFIQQMNEQHDLPLDPVYTGKLLWAVMDYVKKGTFERGSTILALHTGGLQGK